MLPFLAVVNRVTVNIGAHVFFGLCFSMDIHPGVGFQGHIEKQWKQCQTLFFGAPKSLQMVTAAMKLKDAFFSEEKL